MQIVFKSELNNTEVEKINAFCSSVDYCSIEQTVGWMQMFGKSKICYFYLIDGEIIKSFSQINENLKFASIIFGPVCCDKEIMITSINEIINYYKKRKFIYLGIQMYYKSGYDSEYIEYYINKLHNVRYKFDNLNSKSSIEINLEKSIEEIYGKIRKGHKSDIKKEIKLGLVVDSVKNTNELDSFFEIISKMIKVRQLEVGIISSDQLIVIYNYLIKNKKGQILLVKDVNDIILGGIIVVYQGISVRYFFGASDPDRHELPILHLTLYEAIKRAKTDNFKYFDFWGYNHFADESDQVYNINHFKKGFGGYFTFFPKKMNISLIPNGYRIYRFFLYMKKIFRKISFN
jgi:sugar-specific transcriptional regulator TrmB